MRRGLLALLVAAFVGPLVIARQAFVPPGQFTNYGQGASSCGSWIAATGESHRHNETWVLGFVSGFGYGSPRRLKKTDADAVAIWVDNYCHSHPLDTISRAAQELVQELARQ